MTRPLHVAGSRPRPKHVCTCRPRNELTCNEAAVVALIADGVGFDDIAARLFITNLTVSTYVKRARRKLGARDKAHLVAICFRERLLAFRDGRVVVTDTGEAAA